MSRVGVFLQIMLRSMLVRPGRTATALAAIAVASGIVTAVLALYDDVQTKLQQEFRRYGSNVIITASQDGSLQPDALEKIDSLLAGRGLAVPFAYAIARSARGVPVVVAGTDIERVRTMDSWWSVTSWPSRPNSALLGWQAAAVITPRGTPFDLTYGGRTIHLSQGGVLHTGSAEDSRIYLPLEEFTKWTNLPASNIEISATGDRQQIAALVSRLNTLFPAAHAEPVRQITEAQTAVFERSRSTLLASVLVISLTSILCVLTTLTASVLDRRKDFAVMKALGATRNMANSFFVTEVGLLGALGGMIGYGAGLALAWLVGWRIFHAGITPRLGLFPAIFAGSIAVTLFTALAPLSILRRLQPAAILKGE